MPEQSSSAADLLYEVQHGIGRVTFNRPHARNALTFAMYERLAQICNAAGQDRSLKVLVLTGAGGKAFAAGTDINQFRREGRLAQTGRYSFGQCLLDRMPAQYCARRADVPRRGGPPRRQTLFG